MGYIENNLMNDEEVVIVVRLHPVILVGPAMMFSFLLGTFSLVQDEIVLLIPVVIGLAYSGVRLLQRLLYYVTTEYGITSKRVLGKTGFIWRRSLDIVLAKVEAVRLNQSLFGRVFNYGTIDVTGSGGTEEKLRYIPDPLAFRNSIQEQLSDENQSESASNS